MANTAQPARQQEMSDEEIEGVFETLQLSTAPKPVPLQAPAVGAPVVFFTVSGSSPPLKSH
jgi:hypothetical protein